MNKHEEKAAAHIRQIPVGKNFLIRYSPNQRVTYSIYLAAANHLFKNEDILAVVTYSRTDNMVTIDRRK